MPFWFFIKAQANYLPPTVMEETLIRGWPTSVGMLPLEEPTHALGGCKVVTDHIDIHQNIGAFADQTGATDCLADLTVADDVAFVDCKIEGAGNWIGRSRRPYSWHKGRIR